MQSKGLRYSINDGEHAVDVLGLLSDHAHSQVELWVMKMREEVGSNERVEYASRSAKQVWEWY